MGRRRPERSHSGSTAPPAHNSGSKAVRVQETSCSTEGSYEGCDLTAAAAVLFPAVTLANTGKASYSFEPCKNRPTINNQPCGLFTKSTDQKSQMYTDPMCGAPVPFVHRLSEISFLVVETVRQEKLQKHRRSRRQET